MDNLQAEIALLVGVARDFRLSNYCALASVVALAYDVIITLPEEVEHVWRGKWRWTTLLYFVNRYVVGIEQVLWLIFGIVPNISYRYCLGVVYLDALSPAFSIMPAQLILIMRTIALWQKDRRIAIGLVSVLVLADLVIIVCTIIVAASLKFQEQPIVQSILGCNGDYVSVSITASLPAYSSLMVFDTIVFIATMIATIKNFRTGNSRLLTVLYRDGITYYAFVLAAGIANLVFFVSLPSDRQGLRGAALPMLRSAMSIIASRIVLNVRSVVREGTQMPELQSESDVLKSWKLVSLP